MRRKLPPKRKRLKKNKPRKTQAAPASPTAKRVRERMCVVTREALPEARLIRFALTPDGGLIPDVAAKLPGRGAWVSAQRALVDQAASKGAFARALKTPVKIARSLADDAEAALTRRCLDFLGLARRAGAIAAGQTQVEAAIRSGRVPLLIEAEDGAAEGREKLMSLHIGLWGAAPPAAGCFSAADLGVALGRERVIHACLLQERLALVVAAELGRLAGFRAIVPASWPTSWRTHELGSGDAGAGSKSGVAPGAETIDD